ncbi:MAG: hypothetical protein LKF48_07480 [Prevotella sp.]|jgi:hypothetical protein|nr:hypothetical protein [Prevotella sp.]MCH4182980.1 hypothetical protein [Prevotella sp.]
MAQVEGTYIGNNAKRYTSNGVTTVYNPSTADPTFTKYVNSGTANKTTGTSSGSSGSSGSSSSYDSGTTYQSNPFAEYLSALQAARQQAVQNANAALDKQGQATEQKYNNQITQIGQDYQTLKNQSEVNKYKAQKSLREALANRGALNSGAGRQESLALQNNYGNALNKIGMSEQNEINDVRTAINQLYADIATKKAENEANVNSDVGSILSSIMGSSYNYSPSTSSYYATANNAAQDAGGNFGSNVGSSSQNNNFLTNAAATAAANGSTNKADYYWELMNEGKISYAQYQNLISGIA